ncbi:acyltransferase [Allonocardiopsis opalescens]|uniref:Surface polysaccharide O-acyltransferase-like enzyme n=1 Tax=Allonocardiopsis opalescens TaxID=1144618 RepID=A0A2T0Q4I2_9ACTN|nr:acyltransferase family protein [Allonocardiopsis opalescens]PRX98727.1 surface polysaccharide O-acyltransferase-like enzyme [Allonocardiopsis opalescens]
MTVTSRSRPQESAAEAASAPPPGTPAPRDAAAGLAWLDLARIGATVAVVLIHVLAPVVEARTTPFAGPAWWVADIGNSAVRWCVPIFIMISGALLLQPGRGRGAKEFYLRRVSRIGLPVVVWSVGYLVFHHYWSGIDAQDAVRQLLSGSPSLHLYFLYVICGLYVITPFLRVLTAHASRRLVWAFALLMLGLGVVDHTLATLGETGEPNAATRFLPFVGYYLFGWLLREAATDRRSVLLAGSAFLGGIALTVAGTGAGSLVQGGWDTYGKYVLNSLSPTVALMSLGSFVLWRALGTRLRALDSASVRARLRTLGELTFGVFLIHVAILLPLRAVLPIPADVLGTLAVGSAQLIVSIAGSLLLTLVLKRIPYLRATV